MSTQGFVTAWGFRCEALLGVFCVKLFFRKHVVFPVAFISHGMGEDFSNLLAIILCWFKWKIGSLLIGPLHTRGNYVLYAICIDHWLTGYGADGDTNHLRCP